MITTGREVILLLLLLLFVSMLLMNEYIFKKEKKRYTRLLRLHNRDIIFAQNPEMNVHEACYKNAEFFEMQDFGKSPCMERERHEFINCIGKENYYEKVDGSFPI